jgi:hypothetical protein
MGMTGNKYCSREVCGAEFNGVAWERRRLAGELLYWGLKISPAGRQRSQVKNNAQNFAYVH